jgi:hypothetical protein
MEQISLKNNIFFLWLAFHFFDAPKGILLAWRNFLIFNLNYFSVLVLFRTLFSYWQKYSWEYPKGFDLAVYFEVALSNFISRILGAIMRIILIFVGILIEVFIFLAGLITFLLWLILPVIIIFGIYYGFRLLF